MLTSVLIVSQNSLETEKCKLDLHHTKSASLSLDPRAQSADLRALPWRQVASPGVGMRDPRRDAFLQGNANPSFERQLDHRLFMLGFV